MYTLLSIQLIITAIICFAVMKSPALQNFLGSAPVIIILTVAFMAVSIFIGCCSQQLQKYGLPILIVFTLIFGFLVGVICAKTPPHIVALAAGLTALITVALTAYACKILKLLRFYKIRFDWVRSLPVCDYNRLDCIWNCMHILEESYRSFNLCVPFSFVIFSLSSL